MTDGGRGSNMEGIFIADILFPSSPLHRPQVKDVGDRLKFNEEKDFWEECGGGGRGETLTIWDQRWMMATRPEKGNIFLNRKIEIERVLNIKKKLWGNYSVKSASGESNFVFRSDVFVLLSHLDLHSTLDTIINIFLLTTFT
jgi:hypothetical protein